MTRLRLSSLFRFAQDEKANIAIIFALTLVPLLMLVGVAVDYSFANRQQSKVQNALDQALLAGSVAGKAKLDAGASNSVATQAAKDAANAFFTGNTTGIAASMTVDYKVTGRTLTGTGSASSSVNATFAKIIGRSKLDIAVNSTASSTTQPYLNVYLLIDISSSMLLPSTQAGITQMINGTGCALACHDSSSGGDSYAYAVNNGIELRYQVVNKGIQNLLTYLNSSSIYKTYVKVGLWSFDSTLAQMSAPTSNFTSVANNFPAPELAVNNSASATPFDNLISNFVSTVGTAGTGNSSGSPQKLVIIATDGVNDPTRDWVSDASLQQQVKVFNTSFCNSFKTNGVTVAIINTPYYPMTWDWGYNATLGQPGSLGGATRVDDIPIALKACAGSNYILASDAATIQSAFTTLFNKASPIRLTN